MPRAISNEHGQQEAIDNRPLSLGQWEAWTKCINERPSDDFKLKSETFDYDCKSS